MNKSKLFVTVFLASIIIGSPFVIKKLITKANTEVEFGEENFSIEDGEKPLVIVKKNSSDNEQITVKKQKVDKTYFNDALFIGDSRTVGIAEYGDLKNATFFADTGMSIYNVFENKISIKSEGKVKLDKLLSSKKYGKIYIMLGINELGYNINQNIKQYRNMISAIQKKQPDSIIYIEANLHVTAEKSKKDKIFNNENINKFNNEISKLTNNNNIFYIDVNQYFDDKDGNLRSDYTHDKIHIFAKYYKQWSEWISTQAVVK